MEKPNGDNYMSTRFRFCCILIKTAVVACFIGIIYKAFVLQILDHSLWLERSRAQAETKLNIPSYRGSIYDSQGRMMAFSVLQPSLYADSKYLKDPKKAAVKLSKIFGEPSAALEEKLASNKRFIWLKRRLTDKQALTVEALEEPGIYSISEYHRFYPFRQVAGQVLGFVGLDGKGLEGIEKAYDPLLAGNDIVKACLRDGLRRDLWLRNSPPPEPVEEKGLRLTLDAYLQYITEVELEKGASRYSAAAGEVVVIDPTTFEVLAVANWPYFDPNQKDKTSADLWRNRAITDAFEPGSTFKVFLVTAALEEGAVKLRDRVFCENGKFQLARHTIDDVHPHGWLTIPEVIKYSSNIAASKIALQLGSERYAKHIANFGFGAATGIGLPGEAKGIVRPWEKWRPMDLAVTGFGQAIGVTALQLSMAVAAIANGGLYGQPLIAREVVDANGKPVRQFTGTASRRIIQKKTADQVRDMMKSVTEEGGTGIQAAPPGYAAAGKTGTAQVVNPETGGYATGKYTSIFTGFIPANDPRLVITVVIHEPHGAIYGGVVAAPIFRGIAAKALPYLGVPPTGDEGNEPPKVCLVSNGKNGDAARGGSGAPTACSLDLNLVPNVIGLSLKAALLKLEALGVKADFQGSGRVIEQLPPEGTPYDSDTTVRLILSENDAPATLGVSGKRYE